MREWRNKARAGRGGGVTVGGADGQQHEPISDQTGMAI